MAAYALTLHDPLGGYLATLDTVASLDVALPANDVGALVLTLPPAPPSLLVRDARLVLARTVAGVTTTMVFLIRRAEQGLDASGRRATAVTAFDPRDLLRRRIVAVAAQATKTGPADDVMKAIVRENFVTATDADRRIAGFTVAADMSLAPVVTIACANRRVLDVLRDLADMSLDAGTYLAFDVVPSSAGFEFRTSTFVWGTDRRADVVLSAERGTLTSVAASTDWTEEHTAVYASGRDVLTAVAVDAARAALSPFGRIETYLNASSATTVAAVESAAAAELTAGRAREQFSGRLVEQPGTRYGVQLSLGDLVRAEHEGVLYECRVEPVRIALDESGNETIDVGLRSIA